MLPSPEGWEMRMRVQSPEVALSSGPRGSRSFRVARSTSFATGLGGLTLHDWVLRAFPTNQVFRIGRSVGLKEASLSPRYSYRSAKDSPIFVTNTRSGDVGRLCTRFPFYKCCAYIIHTTYMY